MNENEIKSLRQKIRKGPSDQLLSIKPFAAGMYGFVMVMISYYSRVREKLKIDYDSFMIIQTVVSHSLYQLNKKKVGSKSYFELEEEWEKLMNKMSSNNIETRPFFFPLHLQPALKRSIAQTLPVTENLGMNGLYIPLGSHLSKKKQRYIVDKLVSSILELLN